MDVKSERIRELRQHRGWTQQQLAEIADLNLRTIQRIENSASASHESVSALASAFEVRREELLTVPHVSRDELKPVQLHKFYAMIMLAMTVGAILGASITVLAAKVLGQH
jgi:transcriptional regulator with XRE-family HTH domain